MGGGVKHAVFFIIQTPMSNTRNIVYKDFCNFGEDPCEEKVYLVVPYTISKQPPHITRSGTRDTEGFY
jgi:hypothetical protein